VRCAYVLLIVFTVAAMGHDNAKQSGKPTKAQPQLNKAAKIIQNLKKKSVAAGRHQCCVKKSCDLCTQTGGSCACARSVAAGKGSCGQCFAGWKAGDGAMKSVNPDSLAVLAAINQSYDPPPAEDAALVREADDLMLQAKRILTGEKRFACCIRGGCNECAQEGACACGSDLAAGKGVCGECLDGWKAGRGSFPGIDPGSVQFAPMETMAGTGGMGPGGGTSSGWYSSGTSQEPRDTGMPMVMVRKGGWDWMFSGQAFLVYTEQSGERGRSKIFSPNWFMGMASRRVGPGTLTLRAMLSAEAATVTSKRYPLLFSTGETANGVPIVNGQHPHDLFMELAASYQISFGESTTFTLYGGPRGEPALGPAAFPHRASASENPMAVMAHHIQDSTHISNNVVTAGITHGPVTWEVSGFNGREPDEHRWDLDKGSIDSLSTRLTVTPTSRWSGQFSIGRLNNREVLHPGRAALRTTASLTYGRQMSNGRWTSMLIWGRNHDLPYTQQPATSFPGFSASIVRRAAAIIRPQHFVTVPTRIPGQIYNSYLAESTLRLGRNWIWGRIENADRDSTLLYEESPLVLLVDEQRYGRVQAFTAGYERQLVSSTRWLRPGLGAQMTVYRATPAFAPVFGEHPYGVQVFLKVRIGSATR
jgi:hypothetical protein